MGELRYFKDFTQIDLKIKIKCKPENGILKIAIQWYAASLLLIIIVLSLQKNTRYNLKNRK